MSNLPKPTNSIVKTNPAKAAFGYYGSKQRISKRILEYLPPHHCWVELFCGSAAITMAKTPVEIEIINDLDHNIVNAFRQLRENPKELIRAVSLTPYAREEYRAVIEEAEKIDDLEKARRFLSRAMMAVNGVLGKDRGGFSFTNSYSRNGREARVNRWRNFPDRLEAVACRLHDIRVENKNAIELLKEFSNRPATLVYIDPPYLTERCNGYAVDTRDNSFHINLLEQVIVSKCMILVSAYESEIYDMFLTERRGWRKVILDNSTRGTNGTNHLRKEILWINAAAEKARKKNRVPIRLSKEERQMRKFNPERGPIRKK